MILNKIHVLNKDTRQVIKHLFNGFKVQISNIKPDYFVSSLLSKKF